MRKAFAMQKLFALFSTKTMQCESFSHFFNKNNAMQKLFALFQQKQCNIKAFHTFQQNTIGIHQILMFEILTKR